MLEALFNFHSSAQRVKGASAQCELLSVNVVLERAESMNRKTRLRIGKRWAFSYGGNRIIGAYAHKFKVTRLCAINDLTSYGMELDQAEIDRIRLECHYNNTQHLPKKRLVEIKSRLDSTEIDFDIF